MGRKCKPVAIEISATHPMEQKLFVGWSDEEKDRVWLTDGEEWCDFYGITISIPAESIDRLIAALRRLKREAAGDSTKGAANG